MDEIRVPDDLTLVGYVVMPEDVHLLRRVRSLENPSKSPDRFDGLL